MIHAPRIVAPTCLVYYGSLGGAPAQGERCQTGRARGLEPCSVARRRRLPVLCCHSERKLEAIPPPGALRDASSDACFGWAAKVARGGRAAEDKFPTFPANFSLLGGYVRGQGDSFNMVSPTASPNAMVAVGGASTGWLLDTDRDLTVIFLSAGFVEGLEHPKRLARIYDLAIAAIRD